MLGKVLGAIWYSVVCFVFLGVGSLYGWARRSSMITKVLTNQVKPAQESFGSDAETFLILGCDQDVGYLSQYVTRHAARSDMMMVARMDFRTKEITGVSIPRDTFCRLPDDDQVHKINAYYNSEKNKTDDDRRNLTKRAVEFLLGIHVDRVIVIDYDALQHLVEVIGGVPVNVPRPMDYDDNAGKLHIHLKPGHQVLDGYNAMCYVRYRHSNKRGQSETDFQRQQRQKDLLLGFKQAALDKWARLPEIAEAAKAVFGGALTEDQVLSLAFFSRGVPQQKIKLGVIPTKEDGNGLRLVAEKLPQVLQEYKLIDSGSRVSFRQTP